MACALALPVCRRKRSRVMPAGRLTQECLVCGLPRHQGFSHRLSCRLTVFPSCQGRGCLHDVRHCNAYKSGERKHPSMRTLAASLSEQDIADLAAYYESTGLGARLEPPSAARPAKAADLLAKGGCVSCHGANFSKPVSPKLPARLPVSTVTTTCMWRSRPTKPPTSRLWGVATRS
jgi:cytochrome c553